MRKGSDIIGRPVFTYDTGKRLDSRIEDLIFDQNSNQLLGFLVDEKGWFRDAQVLPLENIHAIGPDAVIVSSSTAILNAKESTPMQTVLKHALVLKGSRIMTTDGRSLGTMVDLYFDEQTGAIEGYEASGGLFADAYSGRSFIPAPRTLNIGQDAAFVPPETAEMMAEQVGGIKAAVQTANQKIQDAAQATGAQMQVASANAQANLQAAGEKASETWGQAQRNADTSIANAVVSPEQQRLFVVGRVAETTVSLPDGQPLVLQGETVTPKQAEVAAGQNLLAQLYRATGGNIQQRASEKMQAAVEQTGQQFKDATDQSREQLQALQRQTATGVTNAVVSPEEQRQFIVGKTAQETVTAPTGQPLITEGMIVTEAVVEAAARIDCLDLLYAATGGSVRQRAVEQTRARAEQTGQQIQATANQSKQRLQAAGQQAKDAVSTQAQALSERTQRAVSGQAVEEAKGRRVQAMVRTSDGFIVAAPGQIVTERVIAQAKEQRQEHELLKAVGLTPQEAAQAQAGSVLTSTGDRLQSTAQSTGEQFRHGSEQLQVGAQNLWEEVKDAAENLRDRSTQAIEAKRIKRALGRPVTRVILDRQDNVILNTGDLITNHAIDRARQANILDLLLDSVYAGDPQISRDDLRADKAGEESLKLAHP
ncbi:MAG: PRC-barrel domain-containing protein [Thermosynechococcaceae cyanobacterium]